MVKIAIDYDNTYSSCPDMWSDIISIMKSFGNDVRIVTTRSPRDDNIDGRIDPDIPIIYCDGVAKKYYCHWFANDYEGWDPDIWIDDKPESILENSLGTRESLKKWRSERDH